jgi:DNA (cytosine-5)-methyltransferase 1
METLSIFDLLPEDDEMAKRFKPIKSTDWKWTMAEGYPKEKNGLKVFSCFACGGGSTMGYKLAGCEVLGCVEIDPRMNEVYKKNHNPKYNYCTDIRDFNNIPNEELPPELFDLDILDGSPPCTTFSMAGDREDSWGKKKKFREGQTEQTLDDLSFIFIDTVAKLKPKCVVMENVEGLIKGEAWAYVQRIYKQLHDIGYKVKHWLLKGEHMGIPQTRHRVLFVALRNDINFDIESLDMSFNYEPITYGEITNGECDLRTGVMHDLAAQSIKGEKNLADVRLRLGLSYSMFGHRIIDEEDIVPTILSGHRDIWLKNGNGISKGDIISAQTFPCDYDFGNDSYGIVEYICGMSVPPVMIKRVVTRLIESGVFNYDK